MKNISIIGSGNIAAWFAYSFHRKGFLITQVYSRHLEHARQITSLYGGEPIDNLAALSPDSDFFLFSVKDDCYEELITQIPFQLPLTAHTGGSISKRVFEGKALQYGVIYPYQSISKGMDYSYLKVTLCVEGDSEQSTDALLKIAEGLSDTCSLINEKQRFVLHLAAVFGSNFTNAMYTIAYQILQEHHIDFNLICPLLENTLKKISSISPMESQTGPAKRKDFVTMQNHLNALDDDNLKAIYRLVSEYIMNEEFSK